MNFCLPQKLTEKFLKGLKEGEIDPEKLSHLSSEERRTELGKFVGAEHAKAVNTLFESKLLLKNQQQGMITWAKTVGGLKEAARRDIVSKINKLDKVLSETEQNKFLEDLASHRLGTNLTLEEANKIAELGRVANDAKGDTSTREKRIAYGDAVIKLLDYQTSLKPNTESKLVGALNIPRTLTTVGDWGWTFRQGWGMVSRPQLWQGLGKSFGYFFKDKKYNELRADIISDPDYDLLKGKLRLPALTEKLAGKEEEFMNQFTGKVPVLKNIERSQQGLATFVRFSVAKKMLRDARLAGEDISKGSKAVTDIANSVNNFSGSGNLGTGDKYANTAPVLNAALFSARKISATVNMLDIRNYIDPKISLTARKANLRNLVGSVGLTLSAIYLAKLAGAKVSTNPTDSDFMNVRFGKFHIDLSGGNKTYAVLLSRLILNKTTSAAGKVSILGKGYKPQTRGSLISNFGRNKLSPIAGTLADWLLGPIPSHDPAIAKALFGKPKKGTPFDLKREAVGNVTPMIIDLVIQAVQDDPTNLLYGALFDYFGNSAQIY